MDAKSFHCFHNLTAFNTYLCALSVKILSQLTIVMITICYHMFRIECFHNDKI